MRKRNYIIVIKYVLNQLMMLFVVGCALQPINSHYQGPLKLPNTILNEFSYQKKTVKIDQSILKSNSKYTVNQIEFDSYQNVVPIQHRIKLDYYQLKQNKSAPVILVLPILGGSNLIADRIAAYFAEKGMAAVIVHRHKDYKKFGDLEQFNDLMRQMVFDHMQALDWILSQHEIDPDRIGVFGVSMGGIKGALLTALDHRIRASVIALAAGDLPYLFAYSQEKEIVRKREELLSKLKLTQKELMLRLKQTVNCDPMNFAQYIDARNTLMILAKFDNKVPIIKGEELRLKMGEPETVYLYSGHYTAIPFIYYINHKAFRFFKGVFKNDIQNNVDVGTNLLSDN